MKVLLYFGPKRAFMSHLSNVENIITLSELAISSDKKMREHILKIQGKKTEESERAKERVHIPCLVAFSEEYATISESALLGFLGFIGQYDIGELYLQNPPEQVVSQLNKQYSCICVEKYHHRKIDIEALRAIKNNYSNHIYGQDVALKRVLAAMLPLARSEKSKPATILLYGQTGVGKSETAQFISKVTGQTLFRKQLSMFNSHKFSSYLFGGKHTEPSLAKDLMERESNVILLDEFDKANACFHNAFYQFFDEGIYEDKNYLADVRDAVIICTSNYISEDEIRECIGASLFSRFDAVIKFEPLSAEAIDLIIRRECEKCIKTLTEEEAYLISEDTLYKLVCARGLKTIMRES